VSIILCEPQCQGFEHAPFNAALIRTVQFAYPDQRILFFGEKGHVEHVRAAIAQTEASDEVDWQEWELEANGCGGRLRIISELKKCHAVLTIARKLSAQLVVFCSETSSSLLALKLLLKSQRLHIPVLAILHGMLASLLSKRSPRPWSWLLDLRTALTLPHPQCLRLVVLGDSIHEEIVGMGYGNKSRWASIDHPYLWPDATSATSNDSYVGHVRFGFFGTTQGRFSMFCRLAEEVTKEYENANFTLVGFANSTIPHIASQTIHGVGRAPLSSEEYQQRATSLTYAVWTGNPKDYRLTASASFLDALAYGKPGLYLRNPFVERYFNDMGDIGYLCDDYAALLNTTRALLQNLPRERYKRQVDNILSGREVFDPAVVSRRLRAVVSELRNSIN
jgi:hypothetical protein